MGIISPQNKKYALNLANDVFYKHDMNGAGQKIQSPDSVNSDCNIPARKEQLTDFVRINKVSLPISGQHPHFMSIPGKLTAFLQTLNYFKHHRSRIITGVGIGDFSSKLAFRTTGLKIAGGYPVKYIYINHDFLVNHLDIYLNYFTRSVSLQSLTNNPFSVLDQILAEYGLIGIIALLMCYFGFFFYALFKAYLWDAVIDAHSSYILYRLMV